MSTNEAKFTITISFNGAASVRTRKSRRRTLQPSSGRASMGPRRLGRGNALLGLAGHGRQLASMGPRRLGRGNGRCFSAYRGSPMCFNGAASVRTRKSSIWIRSPTSLVASMGPRRLGRGNRRSDRDGVCVPGCFNGAASVRTRKCRLLHVLALPRVMVAKSSGPDTGRSHEAKPPVITEISLYSAMTSSDAGHS